jgi:hypothetical protein
VLDFAGVTAKTDLSYYQKLVNQYCIRLERGSITGISGEEHRFTLTDGAARPKLMNLIAHRMTYEDVATQMITNFVGAIAGHNPPLVTGRDVLPSIKAIAEGYQRAEGYDAPWLPKFA